MSIIFKTEKENIDYNSLFNLEDDNYFLKSDGSRKKLSSDPENVFLKHPAGETAEDYYTEVSQSKWNNKDQASRADWDYKLPVDPSINPLKGLLKNN